MAQERVQRSKIIPHGYRRRVSHQIDASTHAPNTPAATTPTLLVIRWTAPELPPHDKPPCHPPPAKRTALKATTGAPGVSRSSCSGLVYVLLLSIVYCFTSTRRRHARRNLPSPFNRVIRTSYSRRNQLLPHLLAAGVATKSH